MNSLASPLPALKAVADPNRLRLLRLLDHEELTVGELARITEMPQSSASRHLAVLRRAGLVAERSEGVRTYARLADQPPREMAPLVTAVLELVRAADLEHPADLERLESVRHAREAGREAVFDELAADWDALRERLLGGRLSPPEVASLLLPAGLRIVDAGTGTGVMLPWLSALAGPDGEVIAIEASAEMARRARERARGLDNVDVRRGRIEDLPVADDWADAVVLCLTLGHVGDPVDALRRAARALRPGGRLVVCDVEAHGDTTLVRSLGCGFKGFDPDRLLEIVEAAGLADARRVEWPAAASPTNGNDRAGRSARAPVVQPLTPLYVVATRPIRTRRTKK